MSSLSCLWMLHIVYKDVKQNWLPLAALPMGAALWRLLDLIWGFLLIITQNSLNVQVTAKENLTGSEERAVAVAVTFICFLHPLLSAQTCMEWAQICTLMQHLGAQQGPDTTCTKVTVTLGHIQVGRQPCHGFFSSAPPRHLQARSGTATPTYCVYTWQKDCDNIWKEDGAELLPHTLAFHCVLICGHPLAIPRTWFRRGIQHKPLLCHLL